MKQILFKVVFNGNGVVNFDDSKSQKYTLSKYKINTKLNNNTKLAKKIFFETKDENGNPIMDYKIKVSADCLRHGIFENEVDVVNPSIMQMDNVFAQYLLSPVGLSRGYMFTYRDKSAVKRKSPLTITDAIQIDGSKSNIEVGSKCDVDYDTGKRSDTSFFYTEKIGDTTYESKGVIDLKQLMFVSADAKFDRLAIKPDWVNTGLTHDVLKSYFGESAKEEYGWFTSMNKYFGPAMAENGILLNDEIVDALVKFILKGILGVNIRRNNAWFKTASLQIKVVNDPLKDTFDDKEDGWIKIADENAVDSLNIIPDKMYDKATDEEVALIKEIEAKYKALQKEMKKDASKNTSDEKETKKVSAKKKSETAE